MPDLCPLQHRGLWKHFPSTFGRQVMGPMAWPDGGARWRGPRPGFIAKGSGAFGVNTELTCKWEGRKRAGPGRREFKASGQKLLRLDWGAVNQRQPPGQGPSTKRTKMADKETPVRPNLSPISSFWGIAETPHN